MITKDENWKSRLKTASYPLQGNGVVMDSYDAEKIALLAYAAGLQRGVELMTAYVRDEINNPDKVLSVVNILEQIEQDLDKQLKEVRGDERSTTYDPGPSKEGG